MIPRSARFLACALVLSLSSTVAQAQRPQGRPGGPGGFGGPGGPNLVTVPAVQKELGLSEKQKAQLKKLETTLAQKRRESSSRNRGERFDPEQMRTRMEKSRREQTESVAKILEPKQNARLHEIELQREGIFAVARTDVAAKLKLSKDQSARIEKIVGEMREAERDSMPRPPGRFARQPNGNPRPNGRDRADAEAPNGGEFPGGGPPGEGEFPGEGPPGEGEFPGGGPPGEGGFPGGGPPGGGAFPGDGPPGEGDLRGGPPGEGGPPGFDPEEFRAQFEKMRKERERLRSSASTQINAVLSSEQQAAFKELQGKPFDLASIRPGPGPGAAPRTGRQGNRSRQQPRSRAGRGAGQRQSSGEDPEF